MPKSKQFLYKKLMRFSYKKANLIIANSFDTKAHLLAEKITKEEKIVVIVNPVLPVDYWSLQTKSVDEEWFNDKDLKVVLSVGRLHSLKNFGFLIQVFKEVFEKDPNARLMIVGDGDEKENLLSLINQLSLSTVVKLVNFQQNIFPYYAQAHVFALSSNWEGFGNVLVEALSAGLPVVSTNCPGGPKMILQNGKYGQLIPLGDKSAYAEALLNELHKPKCRDEKLIQYAQNFIVSKIAQDYYMAMTTTSSLLCFAIMNL